MVERGAGDLSRRVGRRGTGQEAACPRGGSCCGAGPARGRTAEDHAAAAAAPVPTPPAASVTRPRETRVAVPPKVPTLVPTLHPPAAAAAGARPSAPAAGAARAAVPQPMKAAPQPPAKRLAAAVPAQRVVSPAAARPAAQAPMASRPAAAPRPAPVSRPAQQPRPGTLSAGVLSPAGKGAAPRPAAPKAPMPAVQARPAVAPMAAKAAPRTAPQATRQPPPKAIFADSNVKEVLAALDAPQGLTGETRLMAAPVGRADTPDDSSLTDTQVLRFLETRREEDDGAKPQSPMHADAAAESGISLLKPDDTGTRRALKVAVSHNEAVSFAVQLQWSVQPVEHRQGTAARDLQRLHPLLRRGQPRRTQVVWAASRLLQRRHLGQAGRVLRALGVRVGRRGAGESAGARSRH